MSSRRNVLEGLSASAAAISEYNQDHQVPSKEEDLAAIAVEEVPLTEERQDEEVVRRPAAHHRQACEQERRHQHSKSRFGGATLYYLGSPRKAERLLARAAR